MPPYTRLKKETTHEESTSDCHSLMVWWQLTSKDSFAGITPYFDDLAPPYPTYGKCRILGEATVYTEQTDILGSSRVISPPFRTAETVKLICLSRYHQQKCFSWILFPIANFGQILMSCSEGWITQLIHGKTCISCEKKNRDIAHHSELLQLGTL